MLERLMNVEEKRDLSASEHRLKQVVASYCYLYSKMLEIGELESNDIYEIFPDEILH